MSGSDLFGQADNGSEETPDLSNLTGEQAIEAMVGEGKKYSTVEELALASLHGQVHINKLESENGELREKAAKAAHVEEILAEVRKGSAGQAGGNDDADQHRETDQQQGKQDSGEDVNTIIQKALDERDTASRIAANQQKVKEALAQKLGAKAADAYRAAAKRTGLDLDKLAGESPQAVLDLVAPVIDQRPGNANHSPAGGNRSVQTGTQAHPLSKSAIKARYEAGDITLAEKHKLEFNGLTELGPEEFYK